MKYIANLKHNYILIIIYFLSINMFNSQEVKYTYNGTGATLNSAGTINEGVKITFTDADIVNNFYTQGQSEIYIYAGVDTSAGHWQYTNANGINVADLEAVPIYLHDDPNTLTNTYSIIIDPKVFFSGIPNGTTVYGIDFLMVNQFGAGGNNQTANFYIDLVDAPFSSTCIPNVGPYDDRDCDGVYNIQDLDDDNDGILDINEQVMVCDTRGFDFSGINTNQGGIPPSGYLFQNRLLTTNNTVYQGATYDLQVLGYSGTGSFFTHIRGNSNGDISLTRDNGYYMEIKLTFSEPIEFLMNEDFTISGNTGLKDNWTFTLPDYDSSYFTYTDPGVADFTVNSETSKSIDLDFLGTQNNPTDNNWEFRFRNVSELTLRYYSTSSDNASNFSMTPCEYLDRDTDGDGIPDRLDNDSDGDGCSDAVEAGHTDTYGNGLLAGSGVDPIYGTVTGYTTGYTGNTAAVIDPALNTNCCSSPPDIPDTDGDGVADNCDLDADNDGILNDNECEAQSFVATDYVAISPSVMIPNIPIPSTGSTYFTASGPLSKDISDLFGYPANSGKIIATINGDYAYRMTSTGQNYWTNDILHQPVWEFSGTMADYLYLTVSQGTTINNFSFDGVRTFDYDKLIFAGSTTLPTGWAMVNGPNDYIVFNNSSTGSTNVMRWFSDGFVNKIQAVQGDLGQNSAYYISVDVKCDSDQDGVPDHLDRDSDNDGCPDAVEAGHLDTNGDGEVDGTGIDPITGQVTGYDTAYTGNTTAVIDATINSSCCDPAVSGRTDTDSDGVADSCDLDDDNDGILDTVEGICSSTSTFTWPIPDTDVAGNSPYTFNDVDITASISIDNPADSYTFSATGTNGTFAGWRLVHNNQNSGNPIVATLDFDSPITIKNFSIGDIDGGSSSTGGAANNNELVTVNIKLSNGSTYVLGAADFVAGSQVIYLGNNQFKGTEGGSPQDDPAVVLTITKEIEMVQSIEVSYTMQNPSAPITGYIILFNDLKKCDNTDTDGDGIPNYLDLDSDNDGCPDINEMGVATYISDNSLNITLTNITGTDDNGIATGTIINAAQIDTANGGDLVGPDNGFHDLLESGSAGVYAGTYLDPAEFYLNPSASNCVCYKFGTGSAVLSKVGISTLNRHVNQDVSHWPEDVPGGYLVLDSKEKPFVITRMSTAEIDAVANPVEGMMAYDSTLDCLKLYDGEGWICIEQTCDQ